MRNLQKILALVLALVMSLSLMATAGARDFTDGDQIDETFAESVDVLTGLDVFQGYPTGDFQPKGDITRAEVAVIIYRIATGDVEDTQVGIYADYNKFSDVYASEPISGWAAGYINYCANAEYIKGRGDGTFDPTGKVTGYEALAMILRVVGYDKNGEFTGADWKVQTAAIANQRKVTQNVSAGLLGEPATREMVAELLCQAILINTVNYTLAYGYQISTNDQDTIAYQNFTMQRLEGVVTGNEYADLNTHEGIASELGTGRTRLELADGEKLVLTVGSDLDDIGESCRVYVVPGTSLRYDLVTADVYPTDKNTVFGAYDSEEGGEKITVANAASKVNIIVNDDTQHFINFDQTDKYTTNIHMRYVIRLRMSEYDARMMYAQNGSNAKLVGVNSSAGLNDTSESGSTPYTYIKRVTSLSESITSKWDKQVPADSYNFEYSKTINAFDELTATDWDYLRDIFVRADYNTDYEKGEVYVGTNTNSTTKEDISDEIRWEDFVRTYLVGVDNKQTISSNDLGYWLKVIDNDGDGVAEYVLQTRYTVAIANNVADGKCSIDNVNKVFGTDKDNVNEVTPSTKTAVDEDVVSGDKVLYAVIDGTARVQKAETVTTKITSVNRANSTATLEDGTVKNQSFVHTHSDGLASGVENLVLGTNYELIYDRYGNLAAFTESTNGQFTLITDAWSNAAVAGNEYTVRAYIDGALQTQSVTTNGSLFIDGGASGWGKLKNGFGNGSINNQNKAVETGNVHTIVATLRGSELMPVDKVNLYSQENRMIDMDGNVIPGKNNVVATGDVYTTEYVDGTAYLRNSESDVTVAALSSTIYYFVHNAYSTNADSLAAGRVNTVVRQYTGFSSVPTVNKEYIEDVYAIGTRATNAANSKYYTAQVVVVELSDDYTGSNAIDSEIVFVPSFDQVDSTITAADGARTGINSSWGWGVEKVTMIRETGATEAVWVDTANSKLDDYDTADGQTVTYRGPGLFYMSQSEKNPGSYILVRMTAEQIRGDGRLRVGFTNRSTATMVNNYATIDLIGRTPNSAGQYETFGTENRALITDSSVFYNLSYGGGSANNSAKLTTSTAADVLAQTKDAEVTWDNDGSRLNESRNYASAPNQRNEVLVYCNRGGSIVYAISFNEYSAKNAANMTFTRDYAQTVWSNCLASNIEPSDILFYGQSRLVGDVITATWADAFASNDPIKVTGTNVLSWELYKAADDFGIRIKVTEDEILTPNVAIDGQKYVLVVNYYNGDSKEFKLEQMSASGTVTLKYSKDWNTTTATKAGDLVDQINTSDITRAQTDKLTVDEFVKMFTATPAYRNNGMTWYWTTKGGSDFITRDYTALTGNNPNGEVPLNVTMEQIAGVTVVIYAEDGSVSVYKFGNGGNITGGETKTDTVTVKYASGSAITVKAADGSTMTSSTSTSDATTGTTTETYEGLVVGTKVQLSVAATGKHFLVNGILIEAKDVSSASVAEYTIVGGETIEVVDRTNTVGLARDGVNKTDILFLDKDGNNVTSGDNYPTKTVNRGESATFYFSVSEGNTVVMDPATYVPVKTSTASGRDNYTLTVDNVTDVLWLKVSTFSPAASADVVQLGTPSVSPDGKNVVIPATGEGQSNINNFNEANEDVFDTQWKDSGANLADYVAVKLNLGEYLKNINGYELLTYNVKQTNNALDYYGSAFDSDNDGVYVKDTQTNGRPYTYADLCEFCILLKDNDATGAKLEITPVTGGASDTVTVIISNQFTFNP